MSGARSVGRMSEIVVLGSGFAGLWAALGAARRLDELGVADGDVKVTVISSQPYHDIRVRNYEADLTQCRIPLGDVLEPAGVGHIAADVTAIDPTSRTVTTSLAQRLRPSRRCAGQQGGQARHPWSPRVRIRRRHLRRCDGAAAAPGRPGRRRPYPGRSHCRRRGRGTDRHRDRLRAACAAGGASSQMSTPRVIVVDHNPHVGSDMGASARPVIEAALSANGVESRLGVSVVAVDEGGATLSTGEVLHGVDGGVVCGHAGQPADRGPGRRA